MASQMVSPTTPVATTQPLEPGPGITDLSPQHGLFRVERHYEFDNFNEARAFFRASDTYAELYGINPDESFRSFKSATRGQLEYWLRDDLEWDCTPEQRQKTIVKIRAELSRREER
jgi:hypothetical protein